MALEHVAGRSVSSSTRRRHGCRCDGCVAAWDAMIAARRERKNAAGVTIPRAVYFGRGSLPSERACVAVEQAIASGRTASRIMADLGITYATVAKVRERMDKCAA